MATVNTNCTASEELGVNVSTNPGTISEFTEYAKEYGALITDMIEWGKKHKRIIVEKLN